MTEEFFTDEYLATLSPADVADLVQKGHIGVDQARRVMHITMNAPLSDHIRSQGPGSTKVTGSAHYKKLKIEPIEYIEANNIPFHEGEIIKYITRWRDKGGLKDLEKVEWYVHRLMEVNAPPIEEIRKEWSKADRMPEVGL